MIGHLPTLRLFVHQILRIPAENRRNVQEIAGVLRVLHPETYREVLAGLAHFSLAEVLPLAAQALGIPEVHRVWFYGLVGELHLRSREVQLGAPLPRSEKKPLTELPDPG